jgi:hypothetical protein
MGDQPSDWPVSYGRGEHAAFLDRIHTRIRAFPHIERPQWQDGVLSFLGVVIKRYRRHPAPNQRKLLDVFEAAGWPATVVQDPLRDAQGKTHRNDLSQTIKDLNKRTVSIGLRFRTDGNGGALWCIEFPSRFPLWFKIAFGASTNTPPRTLPVHSPNIP